MADVKWIKVTTDVFDDEKILLIECLPEADSIIVIWFKLLCFAGKQNNSGVFLMQNRIPYNTQMLSTIFRRKESTVNLALQTFEQFGMIEYVDDVITIPNWGKHQNLDQLENKKEYMKTYMQEYRAKQKAISSGKTNSKTNSKTNVSSADKDIDKNRIDKNNNTQKNKLFALIDSYSEDEMVTNLLYDWMDIRKAKRSAQTEKAIKQNLDRLADYAKDSKMTLTEYLTEVVRRGWAAFYPINNYGKAEPKPEPKENTSYNLDAYNQSQMTAPIVYRGKKK